MARTNAVYRHRQSVQRRERVNAILLPRLLRPAQAAAYLGVGETLFERDIRPYLTEIPLGKSGVGFDRVDLDAWVEQHKARRGRPPQKGNPWDAREQRVSAPMPEETRPSA